MLSAKTLEYLGISEPQIGMELDLDFYWNDIFRSDGTGEQAFHLSGYLLITRMHRRLPPLHFCQKRN